MINLNSKQVSYLRALSHKLSVVVIIGNKGLGEPVLREIDASLKAHELIKIKVTGDDRALRKAHLEQICQHTGAALIHHIGKQLVIYRPADKPTIVLP